ncbi:lymphocyte cytosolic protein 2 [Prionailurus iriomotensis]
MALRNVPFRSDVLAWDPDNLADYFRKLNYKDCEKAVKKHHIDGQRFLNLTENDIQKFPKLRVPILSKPQVQRFPEETESHEEDNGGWSSFEEDDYESPNDDQEGEDEGDYESPNEEEEGVPVEDDADYEPPPSNDEEALQNSILPAKPFSNSNSMYIDRPPSSKVPQQPPVPPQRPMAVLPPPPAGRSHAPLPPPQPNHEEPSRSRNHKPAKLPAPSIDRSTKPPLDRSLAPFDREPFTLGKKPAFPDKPSAPVGRPLGEHLPKMQKPPLPPATERHDRSSPLPGKKPPVPRLDVKFRVPLKTNDSDPAKKGVERWSIRRTGMTAVCGELLLNQPKPCSCFPSISRMDGDPTEERIDEDDVHQRPLPQPTMLSMSSNTFPSRSAKLSPKHTLPSPHMPGAFSESNSGFPQSASLPPYFSQGLGNRPPPRTESRNFSLPVPNKPRPRSPGEEENSLNEEWYVSYITRPEAEAALRKINQDGTFLVRDSSKKTITNPYVLMVLYKDKVYNIQIRYQEESQVYLLGTGLRGKEDFLSVSDIIDYFRKMPLLLIDGKNRGSRYQCTLTHSAGYP